MKTFIVSDGEIFHTMYVNDAAVDNEITYEAKVLECLARSYNDYKCIVFGGKFILDTEFRRADLALVSNDYSHWFVIEVELLSHSLHGHVLPQVRAMRYGHLSLDSSVVLSRELGVDNGVAQTLIKYVPRRIVVISNGFNQRWQDALHAIDVQYISIVPYHNRDKLSGFDIQGRIEANRVSIGFGIYDAVNTAIRMPGNTKIDVGKYQIEEPDGVIGDWHVMRESGFTWLIKNGRKLYCHNQTYIQVLRGSIGNIYLRY